MPLDSFLLLWIPFLGGLVGWLLAANAQRTFKVPKDLILVFSGAFLLAIVVLELLPVVYTATDKKMGYWILLGIFIQSFLEYFSRGAEHGHIHLDKLQKFPLLLWLSLCIHAFIEGFPLVDFPHLAWGMFVHKIPIAFVIYLLLQKNQHLPYCPGAEPFAVCQYDHARGAEYGLFGFPTSHKPTLVGRGCGGHLAYCHHHYL